MIKYQKYFTRNTTVNIDLPKEIADEIPEDIIFDNIEISFKLSNSNSSNEELEISFDPVNYLGFLEFSDTTGKRFYKDLLNAKESEESLREYVELHTFIDELYSLISSEYGDTYRNEKRAEENLSNLSPEFQKQISQFVRKIFSEE